MSYTLVFFIFLYIGIFVQSEDMCHCVPYYLCQADGTIKQGGQDIIDIRSGRECSSCKCTEITDTCCKVPSPPASYSCGKSNPQGVGFKISSDSENALFGEFPWMIQIFQDGSYRCGGSLIHPSVVLTAAHCVKFTNKTYTVRAGEWDQSNTLEFYKHQDRSVSSIKIHKDFQEKIYYYDVALLFLERPLNLSANIQIICLVASDYEITNKTCIATGWGNSRYGPNQNGSDILKKVELPTIEQKKCQEMLRKTRVGPYFNLHESFICAGGEKNKDTCTGDGGGPLMCPIEEDEDVYQQVGITSWGIDCNVEEEPGIYAKIAAARKWIDREMKKKKLDINYDFQKL